MNSKKEKTFVKFEKIDKSYDGEVLVVKNLNLDIAYFSKVIPSAENICIFIYDILRQNINSEFKLSVRLYETPRNFVEYSG